MPTLICPSSERDVWLAERQKGVGSSDAPIIVLGKAYGVTRLQLWQEKLGLLSRSIDEEAAEWGREIEPLAIRRFERETGRVVASMGGNLYRSDVHPWMLATPDATWSQQVDPPPPGWQGEIEVGLLEVKTTGFLSAYDDGPPDYLRVQAHHQGLVMVVRRLSFAVVAGGFRGLEFRWGDIGWDADLAQRIVEETREFWRCVEEREAPPAGPDDAGTLQALHPEPDDTLPGVQLGGEWIDLERDYLAAKEEAKRLTASAKAFESAMKQAIGDAPEAVLPNGVRYLWRMEGKRRILRRKEPRP